MSGHVGDLSAKQAEALAKFRENIQDILPGLPDQDDYFLLKWLRARCFDLQKSEAMIRKHVQFRKLMDAEHVQEWQAPEVIQKYMAGGTCGFDLDGSPIWYEMIGHLDAKGLLFSATKQDFIKRKFQDCERTRGTCSEQTQKLGRKIETVTIICDAEGLGLKHLWKPGIDMYGELISLLEDNYPESLKRIFIIKAPRLFPVAFNLVKHLLSEDTRKKMVVLGANWKEILHNHIDPSEIPVHYGGTRTDPDGDPKCQSMLCYGGDVPRKYFVCDQVKQQYEHSVAVNRGSSQQLEYEILSPGCVLRSRFRGQHLRPQIRGPRQLVHADIAGLAGQGLPFPLFLRFPSRRWQFVSEGADIGFGIYLKTKAGLRQHAGEMTEVCPTRRCNAHLVPEDGSLTCTDAGTYVLRFDNTYSYIHSKKVNYTVEILLPDKKSEEQIQHSDDRTKELKINHA
ncbi:SEC14-like protein 2 [Varanus komodoensis]|nr:SEC14-like protein 2 [Varanus komodoensis]